uniref:Uncharacterized protein n=1 Tax=viral metagenome TaxID=1070528 RepID=A0A6M3L8B9_9ZZZZ
MNQVRLTKQQAQKLLSPGSQADETKERMQDKEIARLWQEHGELLVRIKRMEERLEALGERIDKIGVVK